MDEQQPELILRQPYPFEQCGQRVQWMRLSTALTWESAPYDAWHRAWLGVGLECVDDAGVMMPEVSKVVGHRVVIAGYALRVVAYDRALWQWLCLADTWRNRWRGRRYRFRRWMWWSFWQTMRRWRVMDRGAWRQDAEGGVLHAWTDWRYLRPVVWWRKWRHGQADAATD